MIVGKSFKSPNLNGMLFVLDRTSYKNYVVLERYGKITMIWIFSYNYITTSFLEVK